MRRIGLKGRVAAWWLPLGLLIPGGILLLAGPDVARMLSYTRSDIAAGEFWRLLTGHWIHLGSAHFWLDAAGLLLVWYLIGAAYSWRKWLLVMLASLLVMDLGFWFLMPGLDWYVGLSGLLHGVFAAGIVGVWHERPREALVMALLLGAKLIYEVLLGPLPGSETTAGGAVVTEAHLLGAIGGILPAIWFRHRVEPAAPI